SLPRGGAEDRRADILRWLSRHDLELTAILQELRQPEMDKLRRIIANKLVEFFFQFTASPALHSAKQIEQLLGEHGPLLVGGVEVVRQQAIAGVADADHFAGEHVRPLSGVRTGREWARHRATDYTAGPRDHALPGP